MNNIRLLKRRQIFVVKVRSEHVRPLSFQSSVRRVYYLWLYKGGQARLAGAVPPALQSFRLRFRYCELRNIYKRISNHVRIPQLYSSEFILG